MSNDKRTTVKRSFRPVEVIIRCTASKVNENGTLSGFDNFEVSGINSTIEAKSHQQSGGAIWVTLTDLKGLKWTEGPTGGEKPEKKKLF